MAGTFRTVGENAPNGATGVVLRERIAPPIEPELRRSWRYCGGVTAPPEAADGCAPERLFRRASNQMNAATWPKKAAPAIASSRHEIRLAGSTSNGSGVTRGFDSPVTGVNEGGSLAGNESASIWSSFSSDDARAFDPGIEFGLVSSSMAFMAFVRLFAGAFGFGAVIAHPA